jgi:hypothetical protein
LIDPKPLNRVQLARIAGNDPEAIRLLERMFEVAGRLTPEALAALGIEVDAVEGELSDLDEIVTALKAKVDKALDVGVPFLNFFTDGTETDARELAWNADDGTLDVQMNDSVVLQIGQELHFYAKNVSGATVSNGEAVMFAGTVGASGKLEFDLAVSDGSFPSEYIMGIATENIPNNEFGYITLFGLVRGFNASGGGKTIPETWADGDLLYLDPDYPGELTNVQPSAPALRQPIAAVVNNGPGGSGAIFVRVEARNGLSGLNDVYGTPADGDLLRWDDANSRWEMVQGASGTFTTADAKTVTVTRGIVTAIV